MKRTHLLSLTTAIFWTFFVVMGVEGIDDVRSEHVPGFPSPHQMHYYVYLPVGFLVLVTSAWMLAARWRQFKALAVTVAILALLALPVWLGFGMVGV